MNLSFVELIVSDWHHSVHWYGEIFGCEQVPPTEEGKFALFQLGTGRVALKKGDPKPGNGLIAVEVPDLQAVVDRFTAKGIQPIEPLKQSDEGYRRVIYHDPDGHRISLFEQVRTA